MGTRRTYIFGCVNNTTTNVVNLDLKTGKVSFGTIMGRDCGGLLGFLFFLASVHLSVVMMYYSSFPSSKGLTRVTILLKLVRDLLRVYNNLRVRDT